MTERERMKMRYTTRGFAIVEFKDAFGLACDLQESSADLDERLIWLGTHTDRMHLTQSHVRALLPLLQYFAEHGVLPEDPPLVDLRPSIPRDGV